MYNIFQKSKSQKDDDSESCLYCSESYSNESWIQCQMCLKWAHDSCAGVDRRAKTFVCEICS